MNRILWGITGAGHFLEECIKEMKLLSENVCVDIALSHAGFEVVCMYGLIDPLKDFGNEIFMEGVHGYSSPIVGRLAKKEYKAVVIAPATANTIAKIVHGISDSLITNIVAQALKSKTDVFILPTDIEKELITRLPINIDSKRCINCDDCPPMQNCTRSAFYRTDRVRIDLLRCNACLNCIEDCKYNAITFGKKVRIYIRDIDLENTEKLEMVRGIRVFKSPNELKSLY